MIRYLAVLVLMVLAAGCSQSQVQTEPLPPAGPSLDVNPVGTFQYQLNYNDPVARRAEIVTGQIVIRRMEEGFEGEISGTGGSSFPITLVQVSRTRLNLEARTPDGHVSLRLNFVGDTFTGQWEAENRSVHPVRGTRR